LLSGAAIKKWIATRGPVTGCFIVYADFLAYVGGIYQHVSGEKKGGHCVALVGYDDANSCWIAKNSWGSTFGENGFFRIRYGECGIDSWSGPYGAEGVSIQPVRRPSVAPTALLLLSGN
jgi:C1A family cysteine protease